jgi:hypothetical protein
VPWLYTQDAIAQRYGLDPRTIEQDDNTWIDFIGRLGAMEAIKERASKNIDLMKP